LDKKMPFTPPENTVDTSEIESILLAYIAANQTEALAYYGAGATLKPFVFLEDVIANPDLPNLPSLEVTDETEQTDFAEQLMRLRYEIRFASIVGSSTAAAVKQLAKVYAHALKNVLASFSLTKAVAALEGSVPEESFSPSVRYGAILSNTTDTEFFLRFELTAKYQILVPYQIV
jgi:hypothetical protein